MRMRLKCPVPDGLHMPARGRGAVGRRQTREKERQMGIIGLLVVIILVILLLRLL